MAGKPKAARARKRAPQPSKKNRNTKKKQSRSLLAGVAVVVLLFLAGYQLMNVRAQLAAAQAEAFALEERVAKQEQENRSIKAALERAEDPQYLQALARDQLGMVSPGQKDFYDVSN